MRRMYMALRTTAMRHMRYTRPNWSPVPLAYWGEAFLLGGLPLHLARGFTYIYLKWVYFFVTPPPTNPIQPSPTQPNRSSPPPLVPRSLACLQGGILTRRTAVVGVAVAAVGVLAAVALKVLDTPSRPYDAEANTVGNEYDAWTEVGVRV